MKKLTSLALTALLAVSIVTVLACASPTGGDSAVTPPTGGGSVDTLPAAPAPLATNDASYLGVYKGVVTDSSVSGSLWVELSDSALAPSVVTSRSAAITTPKAVLNILTNGSYQKITGSVTGTGPFAVSFSGFSIAGKSSTMTLALSSIGVISNPVLTITGSSTAKVALYKETSTSLVTSWEGTYTGTFNDSGSGWTSVTSIQGTWNFVRTGDKMAGIYSGKASTSETRSGDTSNLDPDYASGSYTALINGNSMGSITGTNMPENCSGTFTSDSVSGVWSDSKMGSGTWSGKKTQ